MGILNRRHDNETTPQLASPLSAQETMDLLVAWVAKAYPRLTHIHPAYDQQGRACREADAFTDDGERTQIYFTGDNADLILAGISHAWVIRPICIDVVARTVQTGTLS